MFITLSLRNGVRPTCREADVSSVLVLAFFAQGDHSSCGSGALPLGNSYFFMLWQSMKNENQWSTTVFGKPVTNRWRTSVRMCSFVHTHLGSYRNFAQNIPESFLSSLSGGSILDIKCRMARARHRVSSWHGTGVAQTLSLKAGGMVGSNRTGPVVRFCRARKPE